MRKPWPAGKTLVYQVEVTLPADFNDLLCYTVSAKAPSGRLEPGAWDSRQGQVACVHGQDQSCPQPPSAFCGGATLPSHPDLDVELVGSPERDILEGRAVYTVMVQNGGGAAAVGAQVSGFFSSANSPVIEPVSWCKGRACTPLVNPGPFADTENLGPGDSVFYEVAVTVPAGFHDNLCFTVSAQVPGDPEPGPSDSTRSELLCLTDGLPCLRPAPGFCQEGDKGHPDLEVAFFGDPVVDGTAATVLYTVALQNAGDVDAVGAQVTSSFSSVKPSAVGPVSWCLGLGCLPKNPGPLAEALTVRAGEFLFFQVKVQIPSGFHDYLCYTVTAAVPGDFELFPHNTQSELELLCFGGSCLSPAPNLPSAFNCPHIDPDIDPPP